MKQILIAFSLLFGAFNAFAQLDSTKLNVLEEAEIQLKQLGDTILIHPEFEKRQEANYQFIKSLTQALKTENSFEYAFPELKMMSIVTAPDNKFRVFTWQIETQGQLVRHYGAIQMNSKELQLFPLLDRSDDIIKATTHVGSNKEWYGSLYYDIIKQKRGKDTFYFLMGIDINNPFSNKKIIEPLHFNAEMQPVFGFPLFPGNNPRDLDARYIMEYRGDASASIKYDKSMRSIVFDHLVPLADRYEGVYAYYVPDGTFDAFRWKQGQWILERNVIDTSFENLENMEERPRNEEQKKSDDFYRPK